MLLFTECVERDFCELPLYAVLRSSSHARNAQATAKIVTLGDALAAIGAYAAFGTWPAEAAWRAQDRYLPSF